MIDSSKNTSKDPIEKHGPKEDASDRQLLKLSLAALGVVFGDIGTSPLYAIRECFHGEYGIAVSPANVLGVLSLMFWALVMIVTVKYLIFVFRAENQGEGGVMALTALIKSATGQVKNSRLALVSIGLFAACLLYGDGMITPAISVLSAVEGLRIITPLFKPYVVPTTIIILGGLFLIQKRGTARIGNLFGPVILVWFSVLALLGFIQIVQNLRIIAAIHPWYGINFLLVNKYHGFVVLGAVFLVVTGAEALYADMGHFGKGPIRLTWIVMVLPALVLNYYGQGALLLTRPQEAHHPSLRPGAHLDDDPDGGISDAGHHYCVPGRHHRFFFTYAAGNPAGLSAQTQGHAHVGRAYWSDLCRARELAADDMHHRSGPRFPIIQQAGGGLRRSRHLDHAGHNHPVLCRCTPKVGMASANGRHAGRHIFSGGYPLFWRQYQQDFPWRMVSACDRCLFIYVDVDLGAGPQDTVRSISNAYTVI